MPLDNVTPFPKREPEPEFKCWCASGERVSFECRKFPDGRLALCTFINDSKDPVPVLVLTAEAAASLLAYLVGGRLN
jgi:hypothetical protein